MNFNDKSLGSYIMSRCDRVQDCLIWTGAMTQRHAEIGNGPEAGTGAPMAKWHGKVTKLNRLVLADKLGVNLSALPRAVIAAPVCTNLRCLSPDHMIPSKQVLVPLSERELSEYMP
jgi:hypothetical protein